MDILLIEDDSANRASLSKVIERAGFQVTAVENGLAAFAEIQRKPYQAIVCDILLPYMDGIEFYEKLEEDYPDQAQRVLFITAFSHVPMVRRFLERTERPFLPKPFDIDFFTKVVREIADRAA